MGQMPNVICIAGPTASGKSGLAVRVAKALGGEIVNADALQVYRDLRILSARPTEDEQAGIPHHLFGHVEAERIYSTGEWVREVEPVLLSILARNVTPILVGGTGLYFKALLKGIAEVPPIPEDVLVEVSRIDIVTLREEAERVDPIATRRVLGDDPQRLHRIVSVARSTGKPLSHWQSETHPVLPKCFSERVVLLPDRTKLYARIDRRFDLMMSEGALDEANKINALNLSPRAPILKAIGLSHLLSHLDGECDLARAVEVAKRDSRRLAKRQSTWFRNQTPDWPKLTTESEIEDFMSGIA